MQWRDPWTRLMRVWLPRLGCRCSTCLGTGEVLPAALEATGWPDASAVTLSARVLTLDCTSGAVMMGPGQVQHDRRYRLYFHQQR